MKSSAIVFHHTTRKTPPYNTLAGSDITVAMLYHMKEGDKGRLTKLILITLRKPLIVIVNMWFSGYLEMR
jgi:hypothetical protein